jgi:CHAT domain-containing protein/Tfp pilus assembly protein PilF
MSPNLYLLVSALALSAAQPPEEPPAGFRDDFKTDSRKQYQIRGGVTWQVGRLTLADRAVLFRRLSPGWTASVRALVRFENAKKDDAVLGLALTRDKTRLGIGLRLTPGKLVLAWPGNVDRPLTLAQSAAALPRAWMVRIDVIHGLGRFKAWAQGTDEPPAWQGSHYLSGLFWEPQFLLLQVGTGMPVSLEALSVTGPGPLRLSAEQQREFTRGADLNRRALAMMGEGKGDEALTLLRDAQKLLEQIVPADHVLIGVNLHNQARVLQESGNGLRAGPPLHLAHKILARALPPEHPALGACQTTLGGFLVEDGKLDEARALLEKTLAHEKAVLPSTHSMVAITLHNLASVLQHQGDLTRARAYAEQALKVRQQTLPPDHPDIAHSLEQLGDLLRAEERFDEAAPMLDKALALRRKSLPEDHPAVARSLGALGLLADTRGKLEEARTYWERRLAILQKRLPADHPEVALALNDMGTILHRQGRLAQARPYVEEALAMRKRVLGPGHFHLAASHNLLATVLAEQGEQEEARKHYERALAINEKALPPSHPHVATAMHNLAGTLRELGKLDEAERYTRRALKLQIAARGPGHSAVAHTLGNLALVLRERKRYDEAVDCLIRALEIEHKVLSPLHPTVAHTRHNLGYLLFEASRVDEAGAQFARALEIGRKTLPPQHPQLFRSAQALAVVRRAQGADEECWRLFVEAVEGRAAFMTRALTGTAQREQIALVRADRAPLNGLVSVALQWSDLDTTRRLRLLDLVLENKALGAAAVTQRQEALLLEGDAEAREKHARLREVRQRLADLLLQGPGRQNPQDHRLECERFQQRHDDLERELGKQVRAYAALRQATRARAVELAARLGRGGVLIELLRYRHTHLPSRRPSRQGEERYTALLLWQGAGKAVEVRLVPLGKAKDIDRLVHAWRAGVQKGLSADAEVRRLHDAVWAPLAQELPAKAKHLYVAPDGELALVPLEALRLKDGRYLIERYAVSYLLTGRDLVPRPQPAAKSDLAVILADPDYEATLGEESKKPAKARLVLGDSGAAVRAGRFERLPGFAREADAVAALLGGRPGWKVEAARRAAASEEQLARIAKPRLLYCVTHGFFLQDVPRPAPRALLRDLAVADDAGGRLQLPSFGGDPRLRSGLALAGANQWQKRAAKGLSDGWLTALEVENLDLWGTELVVLSACETGLGEVHVGEGVLGLRRAFQLAGARTVVASLWKVPDAETQQLMTDFLQRWLKGAGKAEALRQAQLELIRRLRASPAAARRSAPPLYWAGFICHGAPE